MKIQYVAFDGEVFDCRDECLLHEKNYPNFIMYNGTGEITTDTDCAVLVEIKDSKGVKTFCEQFGNKEECSSVLTEGTYYWNSAQGKYLEIPAYVLDVIMRVC